MNLPARIGAFEIAGDEVRLAIVGTGGAMPTLHEYHAAILSYAAEEDRAAALADVVKKMLGAVKAHPAIYVLCVGSESIVVRTVTVPFRGRARVAASVPVELEPNLAFPIDDLVIDYQVTREAPGETQVLAVAMKQALLEARLDELTAAGVTVESINFDAAGLASLWLAGQRKPTGLRAVIHVRDESTLVTVLHGRKLVFLRQLGMPASRVLADPRTLSREARNTLRAFTGNWKTGEDLVDLSVTGIELDTEGREAFEAGLNLPVSYVNLAEYVRGTDKALARFRATVDTAPTAVAPSVVLEHNRWEAAAGVALAAAGSGIAFELRKGALLPKNPWRGLRGRLFTSAAMGLIAVASMAGYCAAQYRNNTAEMDKIGDEIWTIFKDTFPDAPETKEKPEGDRGGLKAMALLEKAQKKADESGTRVSAEMLARPPLLAILKELNEKLPSDKAIITNLKIANNIGGEQTLTVTGDVLDGDGFNTAFKALKESKLVHVSDDPIFAAREGKTSFEFKASI